MTGVEILAGLPEILLFTYAMRRPGFRRLAAKVGIVLVTALGVIAAGCMVTIVIAASMNA